MTNFKSGSGNLDFGADGDETESEDEAPARTETETAATGAGDEQPAEGESTAPRSDTGDASDRTAEAKPASTTSPDEYPYFVRRNNVGDERDTRLEIHVRDKVADSEAAFRNELAEQLGANEVAKTDAREFALLAAFRHPERVAELMEDEGFGTLD